MDNDRRRREVLKGIEVLQGAWGKKTVYQNINGYLNNIQNTRQNDKVWDFEM